MIGTFGIKEAAAAEAAEEGEAGFQLLVVNFAGTTVTLDGCLVSDTIDAVAGAFATKLDLPKWMIVRLMLEGTQLDAEYTLAHYQITAGCQLHALLRLRGGVPPGDDQREAAAGGGGPAPKKRTQKHAAAGSRSVVGGSGSANSDGGASGSKRARAGPPTKLKSVLDHSKEHGSGRWRGQDVSSEDESPSDGRVAAAAEAAEEPAAAADGGITPEEGLEALRGAVNLFEPTKSKSENLHILPLIEATRATDFGPALTSSSSREDIKAACKSLASKLDSLENLDDDQQKKRDKLVLMLKYPSAALLGAFAKELHAGEGGAAGGEAGSGDREAMVARVLGHHVFALIEHVPSSNQNVELKDICRHIRCDRQVSCREPASNHPSLRPARPDHVPTLHRHSCGGRFAATIYSWRTRHSTT